MSNQNLLTRRNVMTATVGGSACAVALASPSLSGRLAEFAESFEEAFTSPYGSVSNGDHNSWMEQQGETFTTAAGHQLQVLSVILFVPFGRPIPGVSRTRAFAVDFQLVGGGGLPVETIQSVTDPRQTAMDLYLTGVGDQPGRVRAIFN
jgi:hypothetical protein